MKQGKQLGFGMCEISREVMRSITKEDYRKLKKYDISNIILFLFDGFPKKSNT